MRVPGAVELDSFRAAGITPAYGGNTRVLPVTISGNYLPEDCEIKLTRFSYPDIIVKRTYTEGPAAIRGTGYTVSSEVDLRGHDTGSRNLEVYVKGERLYQWPNAFRVERYPSSHYSDPVLYRTFPNTGSNAGRTSVTVYGAGFTPQTQFKLTAPGLPDIIIPDSLISVSANKQVMYVAMDLDLQDTGYRNVVVDIPGDTTMILYRAFKIIAPAINSFTPNAGGNTGLVTLRITGSGIPEQVQIRLTRPGHPDIIAPDSLTTVSQHGQLINAVVDLNGKDTGYYDLIISNTTRTLHTTSGFRIVPGTLSCPTVNITGPAAIRTGSKALYSIQVSNPANTDLKNIIVTVATTHDSLRLLNISGNPVYASPVDSFNGAPLAGGKAIMIVIPAIPVNGNISLIAEALTNGTPKAPKQVIAGVSCPVSMNTASIDNCIRTLLADIYQTTPADPGCITSYTDSIIATSGAPRNYTSMLWHATQKCMPGVLPPYDTFLQNLVILENSDYTTQPCSVIITPQEKSVIETEVLWSYDPNDKSGPTGFASGRFINKNDRQFHYLINFENEPTAAAAAQIVRVADTLDKNVFDLSTFRLVAVKTADTLIPLPGDLQSYTGYIDYRPKGFDYLLKLDAGLDISTGIATWTFTTIDPGTMELTMDPYTGFLPPNKKSPEGQGSIFFDIQLKQNIPANTPINNKAYIYFDINTPIITNEWSNRTDTTAPESQVQTLPRYSTDTTIQVSWTGNDRESGIRHYSIFVSSNGGPYQEWLTQTTATSENFTGKFDSTYSFYSIAADSVGNTERIPTQYDTRTLLVDCRKQPRPQLDTLGQTTICQGDTTRLHITGGASYKWSNNHTAATIPITSSGKYSAIITDSFSCIWTTDTTEITVHPLPVQPVISRHGDTLKASYPANNQWYRNNTAISGATGENYLIQESGVYTVSHSDINKCTSLSDAYTFFPLTVNEQTSERFSTTVHPNPSDGHFTVNIENMAGTAFTLSVFNIQGQMIQREIMVCEHSRCTYPLDISNQSPGIYMLLLQSGTEKVLHPIHKK